MQNGRADNGRFPGVRFNDGTHGSDTAVAHLI